jgi:nucleoside phosphorylase
LEKHEEITMKHVALAAAAIGAVAFANGAFAHEMDLDQDGLYSLAEMRTEYPDLTDAQYAALDTNRDEAVDADELAAAIANGTLAPME